METEKVSKQLDIPTAHVLPISVFNNMKVIFVFVIFRVCSIRGVEYELGTWSDAVQKARKKAVQDLRQLETTLRQDLVNGAVDCHLRLSNANNKNKKKYVIPVFMYSFIPLLV
jgi:hypothetical protein